MALGLHDKDGTAIPGVRLPIRYSRSSVGTDLPSPRLSKV